MILLLRALARVVAVLLPAALALAGLAAAIASVGSGAGFSLPWLAELIGLPSLERAVGDRLASLEADGPVAVVATLCGAGAVLLGLALLAGVLVPRRERLVTLHSGDEGDIAARRRALGHVGEALVRDAGDVTRARVKVRPRRRRGGRLLVTAHRTRPADPESVRSAATAALEPLTGKLPLRAKVRTRRGERGTRVQ
ncbi:MAG: hypothetical protein MSC31_05330 [Solirubrobacteraceae bacterium MAG38_C4-C5]|nr:hypothetical protein [Candidatus Siliceabacter maunaloa]